MFSFGCLVCGYVIKTIKNGLNIMRSDLKTAPDKVKYANAFDDSICCIIYDAHIFNDTLILMGMKKMLLYFSTLPTLRTFLVVKCLTLSITVVKSTCFK